ncbi:MAG: AAA family ATPase [Candidatus Micrarchaeota archaeon]|nr:AAA family ATPase [Candidatus Micrarchaeota archaeon]
MLKKLRLRNWTSHKASEIQLGKGANILLGVMGSGKSSVLEAISFALFGSIPEGSRRKAKLSDLIRFGEENAEVELGLDISGTDYKIIRKINRKESSEAYLYRGNLLLAQTPAMVNKHIEKLLGLNYGLFSEIIYSAQNKIDSFINLPPKGRKEMIDEIIGLNRILKVEENSTKLLNRLRMISKEIAVLVPSEKEIGEKGSELGKIKETIERKEIEKKEIEKIFEKTEKSLAESKEEYSGILEKRKAHLVLSGKSSSLKGRIEALRGSLRKELDERMENKIAFEMEGMKKEKEILKTGENEISKEMNALREEITRSVMIKERKAKAIEDFERIKNMMSKVRSAREIGESILKLEKEIEASKERLGMLKSELEAASKGMKEIGSAGSKCPVCMAPLETHKKEEIENHWKEASQRIRKEILEQEGMLRKNSEERIKTFELLKKVEFYSNKMETYEAQIRELKEIDIEKTKVLLAEKEKTENEIRKETMEKVRIISNMENEMKETRKNIAIGKEMEESEKEIEVIDRKIKELGYSDERYKMIEEEYRKYGNEIERQKGLLEKTVSEIKINAMMRKELESLMERLRSYKERQERTEKLIGEISVFRETLNQMQLVLRNSIIGDINAGINEIWTYAYPYNDYDKIRIIGDKESYNFEVFANGEWKDISTIASGGEKTMFAIALRITLAMVLAPQLSWVILDEPTHNLDENGIEKLNSLMEERLPEIIDQFIIVTHDSKIASMEKGNLFNFYREKSGNDATSVEKVR